MKNTWHGAERVRQAPEASISAPPPGLPSWSSRLRLSEGLLTSRDLSPPTLSSSLGTASPGLVAGASSSPADLGASLRAAHDAPDSGPRHQPHWLSLAMPLRANTLRPRAGGPAKCIQGPSPGQRCPKAHPRLGGPTCAHLLHPGDAASPTDGLCPAHARRQDDGEERAAQVTWV